MKKLIALLLAAIMVMAIFVGCSSKTAETPSTDTPAADTPAADTPAATTDAPADVETPEGKTVKIGFIGWGYTMVWVPLISAISTMSLPTSAWRSSTVSIRLLKTSSARQNL